MAREQVLHVQKGREYSKRWLIYCGFIFSLLASSPGDGIVLILVSAAGMLKVSLHLNECEPQTAIEEAGGQDFNGATNAALKKAIVGRPGILGGDSFQLCPFPTPLPPQANNVNAD